MSISSVTNPQPLSVEAIQHLQQNYQIQDISEVLEFLAQYPDLIAVLQKAPAQIRAYFPSEVLSLHISRDPEMVDVIHVVLSILTMDESDGVVEQLKQLDRAWVLTLPDSVNQHLIVTLGYPA